MNLLDARLVRKGAGAWLAEGADLAVPLEAERFGGALIDGREVTVGVRPHDLLVHQQGMNEIGEIVVEVVEALGFESYVHGWARQAGPSIVMRLDPSASSVRVGERLKLASAPDKLHLFDRATGASLAGE